MRRFVVVGRRAIASPDFSLADIPGTSGRLDVLLRCVRAALLVSHGLRRDVVVYLVLLGTPGAPKTVRIDGSAAKYLRPDERHLATTVKKALAAPIERSGFVEARNGIAVADGGLEAAVDDVRGARSYVLDQRGEDVRSVALAEDSVFFLGDHLGLDDDARAKLDALAPVLVSVGPIAVQADDAIAIVSNEVDRRGGQRD